MFGFDVHSRQGGENGRYDVKGVKKVEARKRTEYGSGVGQAAEAGIRRLSAT